MNFSFSAGAGGGSTSGEGWDRPAGAGAVDISPGVSGDTSCAEGDEWRSISQEIDDLARDRRYLRLRERRRLFVFVFFSEQGAPSGGARFGGRAWIGAGV